MSIIYTLKINKKKGKENLLIHTFATEHPIHPDSPWQQVYDVINSPAAEATQEQTTTYWAVWNHVTI